MQNESHRNHAAVASDGRVSATQPVQPPATLDAHGHDPNDFEWRPVPRRPRKDGWTPEAQQRFIAALARTGVVERACEEVGMSVRSAYDLRNARGGEQFARAWSAVLTRAADRLLDIAFEQAIEGEEVPVYDQDGVRTGVKRKYNTRMAMFLLKAYHPERFRHADQEVRRADEPLPPAAVPVADAVASLAPVTPAEPQLLASPAQIGAWVADAEYQARKEAAQPSDDGYRVRTVPCQPARVLDRAQRRRARRLRQEDREDELYPRDPRYDEDDGA